MLKVSKTKSCNLIVLNFECLTYSFFDIERRKVGVKGVHKVNHNRNFVKVIAL